MSGFGTNIEGVKLIAEIEKLASYGFMELNDYYKEGLSEDDYLYYQDGWVYDIGMSRRGQCYYLLCSPTGIFSIYASEPDGSGAKTEVGDIFTKLIKDGIAA